MEIKGIGIGIILIIILLIVIILLFNAVWVYSIKYVATYGNNCKFIIIYF